MTGRILSQCNRTMSVIAALLVFLMMAYVVADVLGRYLLNKPAPGAVEFVGIFLVGVVYLGISYAEEARAHIRVEMLTMRLGRRARRVLDIFAWLVALIFFGLIMWQGSRDAFRSWDLREVSAGFLPIPIYPVRFVLVIGCAFLCLQYVRQIVNSIRGGDQDQETKLHG